jgi:molybdopterin molybdotransferase
MISEEEALEKILAAVSPLPSTEVFLADALDSFAATDVFATIALPPFDNSAMDGYAIVADSLAKSARLKVIGEQAAGVSQDLSVSLGEAVRIFTGAPMPKGANAVVMQEETQREGDFVTVRTGQICEGDFVRKAGADLAFGQQIMARGDRLRPAKIALLASQGIRSVTVGKRVQVAIVTTGDELVAPGKELHAGQIFESNGVMLASLTARTNASLNMRRHCPDDFEKLCAALREATQYDVAIISGGVSVGERDFVREALGEIGAEIDLWRVAVKPGKPFLFGQLRSNNTTGETVRAGLAVASLTGSQPDGRRMPAARSCLIFGLPGNPVSTFVTFLIFVRPVLLRMMGAGDIGLPRTRVHLGHEISGDETRPHYVRGELKDGEFKAVGHQESHALFGLARANALLRVKAGEKLEVGSVVEVLLID